MGSGGGSGCEWVSTADNDKHSGQAMEYIANGLAVAVHELRIRVLHAHQQTPELTRRLAGRGIYVFCHVNDQVLTDEEGYVRSKGCYDKT